MTDAELDIVVNDNVAASMSRIIGQVRALGTAMNAEGAKIERTSAAVGKSLMGMGGAGGNVGIASPAYARSLALASTNLAKYRGEMERLNAASSVTMTASGRARSNITGRLVSAADVAAYSDAATRVKVYGDEVERLTRLQREAGSTKAFQPSVGFSAADLAAESTRRAAANAAEQRSVKALAKEYDGVWGRVESANGQRSNWWPPEALRSTENFTKSIMGASNATRYMMYDVSRNLGVAGAAAVAFGAVGVVAAARWEASFANVARTTGATEAQLERIRKSLLLFSQTIPVSFSELADIAALGAQMGIAASGVVAYADVIARLTATTNLSADAAGMALGRFRSFFSEAADPSLAVSERTFTNLASSILKVGINSVATESAIVNAGIQISSMAAYAGFTADQVIGLSGALASVGVPPELSRGVTTRLFNTMSQAVSEGGTSLSEFARISGVSSAEFASAWGTDRFAYVFTNFVAGLNNIDKSGGDAVGTLRDLGITSVRDVPVLMRLAGAADQAGRAGGLLAQTMNDARSGWRDNIELSLQYQIIASTLASKTQLLLQNFEGLFATMGRGTTGPVGALISGISELVKGLTIMADTPVGQTLSGITIAVALLGGGVLLLVAGLARANAAAIGFGQALTTMGVSTSAAATGVRILNVALLGLGAIGAIATVVGGVMALTTAAENGKNAISDLNGLLEAMKADSTSGENPFKVFSGGAEGAADSATKAATTADNLANVVSTTKDELYGAAQGADVATDSVNNLALSWGRNAREFTKASLLQQKGFTDLFSPKNQDFADMLSKGFKIDTVLERMATGGRDAAAAYIDGFTNISKGLGDSFNSDDVANQFRLTDLQNSLLDYVEQSVNSGATVQNMWALSGEAVRGYDSAVQMTTESMEQFEVANQEAIESIAKGYAQFVDSGSLIKLTQQMNEAFRTVDDGTTDIDEHAEAVAGFETAWSDAYGGAAFSIGEYMTVFRRAATEQQTFMTNLQTLLGRGVDPAIIGDLAAMGPQAQQLVQALVNSTDAELQEYLDLYRQTGFDSMVGMAAGQLAAETIVRNAAKYLSAAQLKQLSADLASGTPLVDAMAKWQLDAEGKPLNPPVNTPVIPSLSEQTKTSWAYRNQISLPITPFLTQARISMEAGALGANLRMGYASGGYTGPGGKYEYAGPVHRGEFVHKKSDVDQSTGMPKPEVLMRMLMNGRAMRPSFASPVGGFAGGGYAGSPSDYPGGSGMDVRVVELSARDRMLLAALGNLTVTAEGEVIGKVANAANLRNSHRGTN